MNKKICVLAICLTLLGNATIASAQVLNYEATVNTLLQDSKTPEYYKVDDGTGKMINVVEKTAMLCVMVKSIVLRENPGPKGKEIKTLELGAQVREIGVCENGWCQVEYQDDDTTLTGYVPLQALSDTMHMKLIRDKKIVAEDTDVLDFPGIKDGEVTGTLKKEDEVIRTATINQIWSKVVYRDESGTKRRGYIPTNTLEGTEDEVDDTIDMVVEAGVIHESQGAGVFADAVEEVPGSDVALINGVQVGEPIAASSDASLKPLGTFRITHYCPCSICCGPWANGITATGVTAVTNHTIAVDPTQIPYGSQVVINGQVYVAEDCGGAIKTNCIDIYVASHQEGEDKGVYYTDVYLIQ